MPQSIIVLQSERSISLTRTGAFVQDPMDAANVLPYQFVVPFVRIIKAPENSVEGSDGLTISFQTAALMSTPDDETTKGFRWGSSAAGTDVNEGPTFIIKDVSGSTNGSTLYPAAEEGAIPAMTNLGGLLRYKLTNNSASTTNTLRFEIHLICRGP